MSSPDSSIVRRVAESLDSPSPSRLRNEGEEVPSSIDLHRARMLRIARDEVHLVAQGCPWYEVKASTLRESDISLIKEKAGIFVLYEVVIPHVEARAHRPPPGFHTFYINQIDRGLRFPIPKFISRLCSHLEQYDAYTLPPSTPEQAPDLTKFLEAMSEKGFNAHELIEEDLLCRFSFSGKNVQLVGDLDNRMTKAEMMKSLKERRVDPEGTSSSRRSSKEKRKASLEGGERSKKRQNEEKTTEPARATAPKDPVSKPVGTTEKIPEQQSTELPYVLLDTSSISFVAKPSGSISLDFIRRLVPSKISTW
ncbi:hypothetical protein F511_10136 [Dorcoceras hygrometricum]|uniref:Uncharacterized protein n=1 Tax=Dorcoceras hygrometricum TaxID=472368 RepID=A0A2Z7ACL3_9LAMI|nr:hypothetical protein F511_10136 [Dorcoceras hygrometricum]